MNRYDGGLRGRARGTQFIPPRPNWTVGQRLDECLRLADLIEQGRNTPVDDLALVAHLKALREARR